MSSTHTATRTQTYVRTLSPLPAEAASPARPTALSSSLSSFETDSEDRYPAVGRASSYDEKLLKFVVGLDAHAETCVCTLKGSAITVKEIRGLATSDFPEYDIGSSWRVLLTDAHHERHTEPPNDDYVVRPGPDGCVHVRFVDSSKYGAEDKAGKTSLALLADSAAAQNFSFDRERDRADEQCEALQRRIDELELELARAKTAAATAAANAAAATAAAARPASPSAKAKGKAAEDAPNKSSSIDLDSLRCGICMDLVVDPVFTSCQHLFCGWCLSRCLLKNPVCAVCRAPQGLPPADPDSGLPAMPKNQLIATLVHEAFPLESVERQSEQMVDAIQYQDTDDVMRWCSHCTEYKDSKHFKAKSGDERKLVMPLVCKKAEAERKKKKKKKRRHDSYSGGSRSSSSTSTDTARRRRRRADRERDREMSGYHLPPPPMHHFPFGIPGHFYPGAMPPPHAHPPPPGSVRR